MAYEYDEFVDAMRFGLTMSDRDTTDPIWNMVDEVVAKAKAFDEIRKIEDKYYEEHGEFISTEDFVYAVDTILNNYKRSERADDER